MEGYIKLSFFIVFSFLSSSILSGQENKEMLTSKIDSIYSNTELNNEEYLIFKMDTNVYFFKKESNKILVLENINTGKKCKLSDKIFGCINKLILTKDEILPNFLPPILYAESRYVMSFKSNKNDIYFEGYKPISYVPNMNRQEKRNKLIKKIIDVIIKNKI